MTEQMVYYIAWAFGVVGVAWAFVWLFRFVLLYLDGNERR